MKPENLYEVGATPIDGERFDCLLQHRNLVVERIVSSSAAPPTEYVQTQDEWVVLLRGEAMIDVGGERSSLKSGDYLFLPSGMPHTVLSVSEGALWLAVHLHPREPGSA